MKNKKRDLLEHFRTATKNEHPRQNETDVSEMCDFSFGH